MQTGVALSSALKSKIGILGFSTSKGIRGRTLATITIPCDRNLYSSPQRGNGQDRLLINLGKYKNV
jgi:hypothetical protein